MDKLKRLNELKDRILKEDPTPELATQATQLVFGDGNPDADIVFIGEAPGKNEDIRGIPFVGAAGKFLNEMLGMIGLKREDIYISNIVKYRPPHNRDPLPAEKAAFLPYLKEQLDIIQPKLIVTLGRHSMDSLLPGLKISEVHGHPKRARWDYIWHGGGYGVDAMQDDGEERTETYLDTSKGVPQSSTPQRAASGSRVNGSAVKQAAATVVILPLFHPAAALYNGAMRQTLIDDFALIPAILKKL
jgi:DNA polymerase